MVKPCRLARPVTQIPERSMMHQEGLPKLPVPPLKQTCERYLASLEPIVSEEELEYTRELVKEFLTGGVGERLQKGLERRASKTDNWVDIRVYLAESFCLSACSPNQQWRTIAKHLISCFLTTAFLVVRMVDAVSLSGLPYAGGGLHQPWGCPASHALPRSTRTDEVRNKDPL